MIEEYNDKSPLGLGNSTLDLGESSLDLGKPSNDHDKSRVIDEIASHYKAIIELLGEDVTRDGLVKTPYRAAKALVAVAAGYRQEPAEVLNDAVFDHAGNGMIVVKDIEFYSMCEHHILPFFGRISVGYYPKGKIVGLSKVARLVNLFARRLQVQERLTVQVCETLANLIPNDGVMVYCEAQHLCMKMRGVEKQDSSTVTVEYTGRFADSSSSREAFMKMLK